MNSKSPPTSRRARDAVVVGAGPNGLAAAIALARAGLSVLVLEARDTIGGGASSAELTLPGLVHDVCSAVHPLAVASPFFRSLRLEQQGLSWCVPPVPLAHPLGGTTAAVLHRSVDETCHGLGVDGITYQHHVGRWVAEADSLIDGVLRPWSEWTHVGLMARFSRKAVQSCARLARRHFSTEAGRALLAGCAAHAAEPLDRAGSAAFGLVLLVAGHHNGWPFARSGAQQISNALGRTLLHSGGKIQTGVRVTTLDQLAEARTVLLDLTPRQVLEIAGAALPWGYRRRLARYRYGPGVFKIDWALDGPIPWSAEACWVAGTVHVGGSFAEIAEAEAAVARGEVPASPFIVLSQPSLFDRSRTGARGLETVWAYCHVPHGCTVDMTLAIERQIERFAPGFRERIVARHTMNTAELQAYNPNLVGGDITGGHNSLWQTIARPVFGRDPYRTPNPRLFLCSSSTPPGAGVHGMGGYWAARSVLRNRRR